MVRLSRFASPLGEVALAECRGRLLAVTFGDVGQLLRRLPRLHDFECLEVGHLGVAGEELRRFLGGGSGALKVKVDLSLVPGDFDREVLRALFRTRPGTTLTYRELARRAGSPLAARAVGGAMRRNPIPVAIPCHRVLPSSGGLGNYTGGADKKEWLLRREGVVLANAPSLRLSVAG